MADWDFFFEIRSLTVWNRSGRPDLVCISVAFVRVGAPPTLSLEGGRRWSKLWDTSYLSTFVRHTIAITGTSAGQPWWISESRSKWILAYEDDIDMMGTSRAVVAEAFGSLKVEATKKWLRVNVPKTTYMTIGIEPGGWRHGKSGRLWLVSDTLWYGWSHHFRFPSAAYPGEVKWCSLLHTGHLRISL